MPLDQNCKGACDSHFALFSLCVCHISLFPCKGKWCNILENQQTKKSRSRRLRVSSDIKTQIASSLLPVSLQSSTGAAKAVLRSDHRHPRSSTSPSPLQSFELVHKIVDWFVFRLKPKTRSVGLISGCCLCRMRPLVENLYKRGALA